jgi:hypothetical protein
MSLILNNELVNLLNLIGKDNKLLNDYFGKSVEIIESGMKIGIAGEGGVSLFVNSNEILDAILVGNGGNGSGGTFDSTSTGGGGGAVVHFKIYKPPSTCQVFLYPGNTNSMGSSAYITFFQNFGIDIYATKGDNGNHVGIPSEGGKFEIIVTYFIDDPPYFIHSSTPYLDILQKYPYLRIMKAIRGGKGGTWTTPAESVCDVIHLINRDFKFYSQGGDFRGGGASLFGDGGTIGENGFNFGGGGGANWYSAPTGGQGAIFYFRYIEK